VTIGELAARTGLSVRTLRFYADAGVLPEVGRTSAGHRRFGPDAVARARLVRTLRELGVGLSDVVRVLTAEATLTDVAAAHAAALDAQIGTLRLQRAVLRAVASTTRPEELERMTDLTRLTAEERRRILDDYLDAVFDGSPDAVAEKLQMGAPELPDDPTPEQVAAWVELAGLLRDPDYVAVSRRMALRARAEGPDLDLADVEVAKAVVEYAGAAARAGVDPASPEALAVIERVEEVRPGVARDRAATAERITAFTDRRVARYWTLVGVINNWQQRPGPAPDELIDAWEWYGRALSAHATFPEAS
jgi:DNA-binding transcriptional MerR regulator